MLSGATTGFGRIAGVCENMTWTYTHVQADIHTHSGTYDTQEHTDHKWEHRILAPVHPAMRLRAYHMHTRAKQTSRDA